jgi:hypothetical protein
MLSFALKVVWFILCTTGEWFLTIVCYQDFMTRSIGTLSCWYVMMALARAVRIHWIPWVYCIAGTVLQGIVCLGMLLVLIMFMNPDAYDYLRHDLSYGSVPNASSISTCSNCRD